MVVNEVIEQARGAAQGFGQQVGEARALLGALQNEQARVTALVSRQLAVCNFLEQATKASADVASGVPHLGSFAGLEELVGAHEEAVSVQAVEEGPESEQR